MSEYIGQVLYIKPTMVVSVPEFDTPKRLFSIKRVDNQKNLQNNKHSNKLSQKAIGRIKTAINWLVVSASDKNVFVKDTGKRFKFKVNLITLTLPDSDKKLNDTEFKKLLMHPFLVYMKKYYYLKNYVWKVEFQKNGKLHLHLTTDCFISAHVLRHYWNSLLEKNGLMEQFKEKFKHNNPNSTDVHAVWKVKNLGAYIAKYMSKNEETCEIVNGRIWGCNYELSDKNKVVIGLNRDEVGAEMRCLMHKDIEYKAIETVDEITGKVWRQAEIFFINLTQWKTHVTGQIREAFEKRCYEIRDNIRTPPLWYHM